MKSSIKNEIETAAQSAVATIAEAAQSAVKVLANAASEAAKVVATTAGESAKVVATTGTTDHDAITTLIGSVTDLKVNFTEKFADLKIDIQKLGDGTAAKITALEADVRSHSIALTQIKSYGTALLFALTIIQFLTFPTPCYFYLFINVY